MSVQSNPKELKDASKFMSLVLRHAPKIANLTLDNEGWTSVDQLLTGMAKKGIALTRQDLEYVVLNNDKSRFGFDSTGMKIRANQGHSLKVDLKLEATQPPAELYHGTHEGAVPPIQRDGLRKMKRHHVHLSSSIETASKVGSRRGHPVIFHVDAKAMADNGLLFYRSENGVWLTEHVPPAYLTIKLG